MPSFPMDNSDIQAALAHSAAMRAYHAGRAEALLARAEAWTDVDEETLSQRGYGMAQFWVQLAQLHLAIRDLK